MEHQEPVVFATAFEGLYLRGLKGRVTPTLTEQLRGIGVDLDRPFLPAYPLETWVKALCATSQVLYPGRSLEAGCAELGRRTFLGLGETTIGKALFPMFRMLGPRRVLQRMTRSLRNGSNFIDTRLLSEGEQEAEIWFNRVSQVGFYVGVLEAGLQTAGAEDVRVELGAREGESVIYKCRWS